MSDAVDDPSDESARYRQLLEELFGARRAGVVFGLERMRQILAALDHPERELGAIVHVAGTNGKGSTVAMVAAMARAHGKRVAQYTSPHLASVRERIAVDDEWISRREFLDAADRVWAAGGRGLTFFEQLTAIGFVALAARRPEITVLEVGLGGRLDATNVVASEVAVVTGIALDHQAMLGDTLEQIAVEKAGIFRRDRPAIIGASGEPAAVATLLAEAAKAGVTSLRVISERELATVPPLALAGDHQRRNAASAIAAIDALAARGHLPYDDEAIRRGLLAARHPGRFEEVARDPRIIIDGAHNPHGALALAWQLSALPRPRVLILAVSSDKDLAGIAAPLLSESDAVIATAYRQERAMSPAQLAARLRQLAHEVDVAAAADIDEALARARPLAGQGGAIVVAGSLFLVGEARVALLGGEVDPIRLSDPPPRAHLR